MTRDDIERRLAEIRQHAAEGDYEAAHGDQDSLLSTFVEHVAKHGPPELAELARLALTVYDIDFNRWCA